MESENIDTSLNLTYFPSILSFSKVQTCIHINQSTEGVVSHLLNPSDLEYQRIFFRVFMKAAEYLEKIR